MAGALEDIDLLTSSVEALLRSASELEKGIMKAFETSAATGLVNGVRSVRLQRTILAVGVFSLFESLLQDEMGWDRTFDQLRECLKSAGQGELAQRFDDYKLAINVLKHGLGPSYELLRKRADSLEFQVKKNPEDFFFEGDVSEGQALISVDNAFVEHCAEVVEKALGVVREVAQRSVDSLEAAGHKHVAERG